MSLDALRLVFDGPAKGTARLAALSIANHHNGITGQCDPRFEVLMEESGISKRTLIRAVADCEALGVLTVVPCPTDRTRNTYQFPGLKCFTYPALTSGKGATMAPKQDVKDTPKGATMAPKRCHHGTFKGATMAPLPGSPLYKESGRESGMNLPAGHQKSGGGRSKGRRKAAVGSAPPVAIPFTTATQPDTAEPCTTNPFTKYANPFSPERMGELFREEQENKARKSARGF